MKVRFLADANLDQRIVNGLRRRESALDFRTAEEAQLQGRTDLEVLELAANQGRILVTHDRRTMPAAFGEFIQRRNSPGVLIVPQSLSHRLAIEELLLIWIASDAEDWFGILSPIPLRLTPQH